MKQFSFLLIASLLSLKGFSQTKIEASEVAQHVGDSVIVFGKVVSASYSQTYGASLFQIERPNSQTFDVLIKSENRNRFSFQSESEFLNKTIRIIGKISSANSRYQIYITTGQQIVAVLGE